MADFSCLALNKIVMDRVICFRRERDWMVELDIVEGTLVVRDPDKKTVYRALRKGRKGQPWIVLCFNSRYITWS